MNYPHKKSAAYVLMAWLTLASYSPVGIGYCSDLVLCIGQNQEALVESGRNGLCGPATYSGLAVDATRISSRSGPGDQGHCQGCLDITISARTTNANAGPVFAGGPTETGSVSLESGHPAVPIHSADQIFFPHNLKPPESPTLISFRTVSLLI